MKKIILILLATILYLPSMLAHAELSQDIMLQCSYERITSSNESISRFAPKTSTMIFYFDPVGKNFYNENRERTEASIDDHRIYLTLGNEKQMITINIDRLTGLLHLNKILTREAMIEMNPAYNGGALTETFEGACVRSDGGKQF